MSGVCNPCDSILVAYQSVRDFSRRITDSLSPEDCMVQSMDDVSPTRWHLAHTTWFFETFVLRDQPEYKVFDEDFNFLFNSYYNTLGQQYPRSRRGLISRPGLDQIWRYRAHVDTAIVQRLASPQSMLQKHDILQVGLQHEQQHQELMLTDIKHVLSCNSTWPVYESADFDDSTNSSCDWIDIPAGLYTIGHCGNGFAFDNESPSHQVYLHDAKVATRLVTCGEYVEFMEAGGYTTPEHWLSLGWNAVSEHRWQAPLYWVRQNDRWMMFTLAGLKPIDPDWPVCHVSLFEADAYARWRGMRLPTEFEWEVAAQMVRVASNNINDQSFADNLFDRSQVIHPTRSPRGMMGGVWQWTSSSYAAYPGYATADGAIGEYNGKFMCNQYVLRGGSVATHSTHIRPTYRNFFPADTRWQFAGIRVADLIPKK